MLAVALAVSMAPGPARAYEPGASAPEVTNGTAATPTTRRDDDLSEGTDLVGQENDLSEETARSPRDEGVPIAPSGPQGPGDPGAEQATRWTAEGQRRRSSGDLDGAIAAWQQATAALPVTQATAHRRAGLALAIATAHADAGRLRAAITALDAYLAGLDPTDDENRVAVEQRRAELAAREGSSTGSPMRAPTLPRGDRRLVIAGGVALGLGGAGLVAMLAGLLAGSRADRDLAAAIGLAGDDPRRDETRDAAVARGLLANRTAIVGASVGGALLVVGVALTFVGVGKKRRAPARRAVPTVAADGLRWHF